jgi:hypothetical protein
VNFSCKGKACPQCGKRYARDSIVKIATKLFPGVSYRQVVLTLPEQLRTPFHNHPNQSHLYLRFMGLAEPCLTELIQAYFKNSSYKIALTVFLHTNGRNGSYNPHLHVILAEGALLPGAKHWRTFKHLSLSCLRLLWQQYLLAAMESEFPERNAVIQALRDDYPDGFYAHPGNRHKEKVPTKSYQGLIRYLTKYLSFPPSVLPESLLMMTRKLSITINPTERNRESTKPSAVRLLWERYGVSEVISPRSRGVFRFVGT